MWNFRAERRRGKIVSICLKFLCYKHIQRRRARAYQRFHPIVSEKWKTHSDFSSFPFGRVGRQSLSLCRSVVDRVSLLHSKAELSWLPLSLYNLDCMIRWERLANTSARNDCAWRQWERKHTKRSDTHTSVSSAQTDGSEKTENFPEPPSVIALLQTHQVETLGREEKKK